MYTVTMTSILYLTKVIYIINPELEVFQVTAVKSFLSCIFLVLVFNVNLKNILYTSVDKSRDALIALTFKTFQSAISVFISYNAMKYFYISTTNVVVSLTPLFACVLAYFILGETISSYTIGSICLVLSSVILIILGAQGEEEEAMKANMWAMFLLGLQPILLAGGMIANRKMKKNHPFTLPVYTAFVLFIASLIGITLTDGSLDMSYASHLSL